VLLGSSQQGVLVKSKAHPRESFYRSGSKWLDLYYYRFTDLEWRRTANFCIKGLCTQMTPTIPDLQCINSLNISNVQPGSKATSVLTIENVGEPLSNLDWEIVEWPEWGTWTFTPMTGDNLKPNCGEFPITVSIKTPYEKNTTLSGEVKIVNTEDHHDFEIIQVTLTTSKNKQLFNLYHILIERFLQHVPLIRNLL
jgi:hypothetical protein